MYMYMYMYVKYMYISIVSVSNYIQCKGQVNQQLSFAIVPAESAKSTISVGT